MSRTLTVPVAFLIVILSVFSALIIASIFSALDPSILDGTTPSLSTYISMFVGQYEVAWEDMAAAAVVTMLPPFLIALFFQRFLIRGMTLGAVK